MLHKQIRSYTRRSCTCKKTFPSLESWDTSDPGPGGEFLAQGPIIHSPGQESEVSQPEREGQVFIQIQNQDETNTFLTHKHPKSNIFLIKKHIL